MADEADIGFERRGALGVVTLNRPKALNALNLPMIRGLQAQLDAWREDADIGAVAVLGAGDRAFCAGGDVRAVYEAGKAAETGQGLTADFFREEYRLNHTIHTYPKPYIALVNGISMGGGVGLSIHGQVRAVTETLMFAMPETGIGLFPDVGGGWFLPRCPGETGTYLALTGHRCGAADAYYVGYATHHVPQEALPALVDALARQDLAGAEPAGVADVVATYHRDPGEAPLAAHRDVIDRCFAFDTVEEIVAALRGDGSAFATQTLATLDRMSPTSLKIALRQLRTGRGRDYSDVVTMEYRLSQACMREHDFYEGIRALLVDKDKSPKWRPARLDDVGEDLVDRHFAPLGERDLILAPAADAA